MRTVTSSPPTSTSTSSAATSSRSKPCGACPGRSSFACWPSSSRGTKFPPFCGTERFVKMGRLGRFRWRCRRKLRGTCGNSIGLRRRWIDSMRWAAVRRVIGKTLGRVARGLAVKVCRYRFCRMGRVRRNCRVGRLRAVSRLDSQCRMGTMGRMDRLDCMYRICGTGIINSPRKACRMDSPRKACGMGRAHRIDRSIGM